MDNKIIFSGILIITILFASSISLASIQWESGGSESEIKINPESGRYYCSNETGKWGWSNGDFIAWNETGYECDKNEGQVDPDSTYPCCPPNMACNESSGQCYTPPIDKEFCYEYETESSCENAPENAAIRELKEIKINDSEFTCDGNYGSDKGGWYVVVMGGTCRCKWDGDNCIATYDTLSTKSSGGGPEEVKCYMPNTKIENCSEGQKGKRTVSWTWYYRDNDGNKVECDKDSDCDDYYSADGEKLTCESGLCKSSICQSGQRTSPCISGTLLGYFDVISIIIAIILIIAFYIIVIKKKRDKKK